MNTQSQRLSTPPRLAAVMTWLAAFCILSPAASAQRPTDAEIVRDAVIGTTLRVDRADQLRLQERTYTAIHDMANRSDDLVNAKIVFNRGLLAAEVAELASAYEFEVFNTQVKQAQGDTGRIATIGIGGFNLLLIPGDLEQRLYRAASSRFLQMAGTAFLENPDDPQRYQDVLVPNPRFYMIEVLVPVKRLAEAIGREDFAALLFDPSTREVEAKLALREQINSMRVEGAPVYRVRLEPGQTIEDAMPEALRGQPMYRAPQLPAGLIRDIQTGQYQRPIDQPPQ